MQYLQQPPDPNYKADDLLAHIIFGDAQILRFNDPIYEWTFNTYQVTVQASSSMIFVDHTLIPEIGIWVYDSRGLTAQWPWVLAIFIGLLTTAGAAAAM